jgi:hypothetical protein
MAEAIRGADITITINVAGVFQQGIFRNLTRFTINNRDALVERELLGHDTPEIDYIHNGYDLAWTNQVEDATGINLMETLVDLYTRRQPLPAITISVKYDFRDNAIPNRVVTYAVQAMRNTEEGFENRPDYVTMGWEAKAKNRTVAILPA